MNKTLSTILTVFKVLRILAKIVFVLCIIGAVGCTVGFLATVLLDNAAFLQIDSFSSGLSCFVGIISCAGGAAFSFLSEKYFTGVINAQTPFTLEGSRECCRLGVASIVISAAVSVICAIAEGVVLLLSNLDNLQLEVEGSISISTGLFFIFLSLIFKYGAQLQKESEDNNSGTEDLSL